MESTTTARTQAKIGLLLLAYIAFVSLGLPDGLLGVAWPSIRSSFAQPLDSLGQLLLAATAGYFVASFLNGHVMARLGVGGLIAASCAATGTALIGYTLVPQWWMMVLLGVLAGLGAGAIDAGLNTYIAAHHGEGLMQWLHASFGIGITTGPIIMTTGLNVFNSWRVGYIIVGAAQITLALGFLLTASRWSQDGASTTTTEKRLTDYKTPIHETLRQPRAWISMSLFFVYVGIELGLGHWAYTLLTESRGIAPQVAGLVAGGYWGTFTIGRFLAGFTTKRLGSHRLLQFSLLGALLGVVLVAWNPSNLVSLFGVAITGFAIAPIFPAMVSGTSRRVGHHHAANTIGAQMAAAGLGGALLPGLAGTLARHISLEVIPFYLIALIAMLMILYSIVMRPVADA